jgi:hypothetical protein
VHGLKPRHFGVENAYLFTREAKPNQILVTLFGDPSGTRGLWQQFNSTGNKNLIASFDSRFLFAFVVCKFH